MNSQNRVGPYTVTKGYRGLGEASGRVYQAVHAEKGTPAVLVTPGPAGDWAPGEEWAVRATAATEPACLVLEVERAPAGASLPELTMLLYRLTGAMARLEGRPDAQAHLASGPVQHAGQAARHRPHRRRIRAPLALALWAPVLAAVLLYSVCAEQAAEVPPAAVVDLAPELLEEVPDALGEGVMTDGAEMEEAAIIGRGLPAKPFKNQKLPPCDPTIEVERNGGCWMVLKAVPPCPDKLYEHGSECLTPVLAAPRLPSSILR